jgi:type VI secretion system protein ImpA
MDSSHFADWLTPCETDAPCGIALDYDAEFLAFETALQGKPEQQYGDTIIPAEKPDWRAIRASATELLKRSKDLRVAGALTRSLTVLEGLPGLGKGIGLISALLNNHWEDVHPRIEQEGERDPFMRANALAMLSDTPALMSEIRECPFVSGSGTNLSVRDTELVLAPNDTTTPLVTRDQLQNMLMDRLNRDATKLEAVEYASAQLETIAWLCNTNLDAQETPDLRDISKLLKLLSGSVAAARGVNSNASMELNGGSTDTLESGAMAIGGGVPTRLASRADAIRALDAVCAYFEQHEPSSPVPMFLNRAKKLTGMRFVDIIREMSPESMNTIDLIVGTSNNS